jgi:imidazolonepropionase-like amidohydrolase
VKPITQSILLVCCLGSFSLAQDTPQAYVGARIIPIGGPEIPEGVLVVHQGKIVAVGPARSTSVPASAQRHDVKGRVIMPGLVGYAQSHRWCRRR